ncbi:MAG: type II toxin-antitoxin system prevent-host-death family antitoxin [Chloroflexota bacterium]
MSSKDKQSIIDELTRTGSTKQPLTITCCGQPIAVVLPVEDFRTFQAEREEKLKTLRIEFNGVLRLIRNRLKNRLSPIELEAQLAAHRQKILQETR